MPRYYFDIRDRHGTEFDNVGIDLPDIEAARREARRALAEELLDSIPEAGTVAVCVEIRDASGREIVEVVAASDDRDRK